LSQFSSIFAQPASILDDLPDLDPEEVAEILDFPLDAQDQPDDDPEIDQHRDRIARLLRELPAYLLQANISAINCQRYRYAVHDLPRFHNVPALVLDVMYIPNRRTIVIPLTDIAIDQLPVLQRNYIYLVLYANGGLQTLEGGELSWYDLWREYEDEIDHILQPIEPRAIPFCPFPILRRPQPLPIFRAQDHRSINARLNHGVDLRIPASMPSRCSRDQPDLRQQLFKLQSEGVFHSYTSRHLVYLFCRLSRSPSLGLQVVLFY